MESKSILIIGAGISGLSAGCFGQMNGYQTRIFEMHDKPGGLCTAWKREGFTIGTSGWLTGSGPANNDFHRFWQELGALQGRTFLDYEEFARIEGKDGKTLILHTDIDLLEQHLLELAPEDAEHIAEFIQVIRMFSSFKQPLDVPPELAGPPDPSAVPPLLTKWIGMSIQEFAQGFTNPFLREAFGDVVSEIFFSAPDASMLIVCSTLALMSQKAAGYPVGGSLKMVRAIERRYLDLGGTIDFESRVVKILVEGDRAVGVLLEDGSEHRGDIVISAADGHTTLYEMLEGRYLTDEIEANYETLRLYPPLVYISLGIARTFEDMPISVAGKAFPIDEPFSIGEKTFHWLVPHIYTFDPTLAPEGYTLVRIMLYCDYEYWKDLRENDRRKYKEEQERVADHIITQLDKRFPGFASQVEMCDVATPETFERYTGNWRGSWMGWVNTPQTLAMYVSKTLPGLENFYMIGTWVQDSGLSFAMTSGRHAIQIICAKDGRKFTTTAPILQHS